MWQRRVIRLSFSGWGIVEMVRLCSPLVASGTIRGNKLIWMVSHALVALAAMILGQELIEP
jgi:hypothetical protein